MIKCNTSCKWFVMYPRNFGECMLAPGVVKEASARCTEPEKRKEFNKIKNNINLRRRRKLKQKSLV